MLIRFLIVDVWHTWLHTEEQLKHFFVLFWQVTNFIERLMQNASNGEVLLFKKTLEQKFENLFVNTPGKKTFCWCSKVVK